MVPYTRLLERKLCVAFNNNLPHSKNDEDVKSVVEENDTSHDDANNNKHPIIEPARQISG